MPPDIPNTTWESVAKAWNGDDSTRPSDTEIQDMYEIQLRIDAGEDVVVPGRPKKKKEEKVFSWNGMKLYPDTMTTTQYYMVPKAVDTILAGNLVTTDPSKKNAVNKYTGKKMKYHKNK